MSHNNKIFIDRVKDKAYGFNDLMLKKGGAVMRGAYSLQPIPDALMSAPLAMKTGGIVDAGLYKTIQNIGYGNKTYIPTI
jgi:hypothetical protein